MNRSNEFIQLGIVNKKMIKTISIIISIFQLNLINLKNIQLSDAKKIPLEDQYSTCLIYSDKIYEYLYAASIFNSLNLKRTVFSWKASYLFDSVYYSSAFNYTDRDPQGVWHFVPVDEYKDTFFIRNKYYKDYMYAAKSLWKERRYVYTSSDVKSSDPEAYMWKLKKSTRSTKISNEFYITNVKYEEKLAPVETSEKTIKCQSRKYNDKGCKRVEKPNREVFTWSDKETENKPGSFEWLLKCRNGNIPHVSEKS